MSYLPRLDTPGPRSFPPDTQGKALRLLIHIRAMPVDGGQPLPRWVLSTPALCSPAPVRSPDDAGGLRCRVSAQTQKEPVLRGVG